VACVAASKRKPSFKNHIIQSNSPLSSGSGLVSCASTGNLRQSALIKIEKAAARPVANGRLLFA
jgi:hypothetical protein